MGWSPQLQRTVWVLRRGFKDGIGFRLRLFEGPHKYIKTRTCICATLRGQCWYFIMIRDASLMHQCLQDMSLLWDLLSQKATDRRLHAHVVGDYHYQCCYFQTSWSAGPQRRLLLFQPGPALLCCCLERKRETRRGWKGCNYCLGDAAKMSNCAEPIALLQLTNPSPLWNLRIKNLLETVVFLFVWIYILHGKVSCIKQHLQIAIQTKARL